MNDHKCLNCEKSLDKNTKYCSVECKINYHITKPLTPRHMTDPLKIMEGLSTAECCMWTGSLHMHKYPIVIDPETHEEMRVRKYLYTKHKGEVPKNMYVGTICNNPRCVRLEHLKLIPHSTCMRSCVVCDKEFSSTGPAKYCSAECNFIYNTDKTSDPNGCWIWKGSTDIHGYGLIKINNKRNSAHRYSYEYHKITIPEGMHVLHSCDNPRCVNPEHLRVGTHQENMQDMIDRDRQIKGEDHPDAKLTEEQVADIYTSSESVTVIAKKYGIYHSTVKAIRDRTTWEHVTKYLVKPIYTQNLKVKLSEEQVKYIYTSGLSNNDLAERFDVDTSTIRNIRKDRERGTITKDLDKADSITHSNATLTKEQVTKIYLSTETNAELGRKYNTHRSTIRKIRNGSIWKHVTKDLQKPDNIKNGNCNVTKEQVISIYLDPSNESLSTLAKKYNTSNDIIWKIRNHKTWTSITKDLKRPDIT